MTTRQVGSRTPFLWRRWAGLLAAAVLAMPTSASAAGVPGTRHITLAGKTTITWSGARGIRLDVPRSATLPANGGTRLWVRGGTYAFVRYIRFAECRPPHEFCNVQMLSYVREYADVYGNKSAPGLDHERLMTDPPVLVKDSYDLYLFTDGVATLELNPTGLSGRITRQAVGRVTGNVSMLPNACPTTGCSAAAGYGDRLRFGGVTRDVGRFGYAETRTYNFDRTSYPVPGVGVPYAQPHPARACVYPSLFHEGSSSPADHPLGCDVVSTTSETDDNVENAQRLYMLAGSGVTGYGGAVALDWHPQASGHVYLGFQAANAYDLPSPRVLPYVLSFRYGIS